MPNRDVLLEGDFVPVPSPYKVEHYWQKVDGSGYDLHEEETVTDVNTGTEVTASPKTYPAMTFNPDAEGTKVEGAVTGYVAATATDPAKGEQLVLKLYYDREKRTTRYAYKNNVEGQSEIPAEETHTYGEQNIEPKAKATAPGYTFKGWTLIDDSDVEVEKDAEGNVTKYTMPARDVLLQGEFVPNDDTGYTVEFYKQNPDGTYSEEPTDSDSRTGTTGTRAETTPADREKYAADGYRFDASADNVEVGNIKGDGSLKLKLYFKPRTDIKYVVEYYYQEDGAYPDTPTATNEYRGTAGTTVEISPEDKTPRDSLKPADTAYALDNDAPNVFSAEIKPDGTLALKVYFKQQFAITYKDGADAARSGRSGKR